MSEMLTGHSVPENVLFLQNEAPIKFELAPFLPDRLSKQVDGILGVLDEYNDFLPEETKRPPQDFRFLKHFYKSFIADRNRRSEEVASSNYKFVLGMTEALLPMRTLFVQCMDGRVKPVLTNGFTAGISSSLRVPGGILKEFTRESDGKLHLDENSNFAQLLDNALELNGKPVAEVFDSHIACAKRGQEEAARGKEPEDGGLLTDILHKREMAEATQVYVKNKYGDNKQVSIIQTSFDPHSGYIYMGLETAEALSYAKDRAREKAQQEGRNPASAEPVYTKEVLQELVEEGYIISTKSLVEDPNDTRIRDLFEMNAFDIDLKKHYVEGAYKFWNSIAQMREQVLPILIEKLAQTHPELMTIKGYKELEERAMLLLTNGYHAFLQNRNPNQNTEQDDSSGYSFEHSFYQYGEHDEEGVKASRGGHPPYEDPMFVVYDGEPNNLPEYIELASELVRNNRKREKKPVIDKSGTFKDPYEFAKATVPVVLQEIIESPDLTAESWEVLENIDWSDLPHLDWLHMSDEQFDSYLGSKSGILPQAISRGLKMQWKKMKVLYDPTQPTASHLRDMYKVAIPMICDDDRAVHAVIPFIIASKKEELPQKIAA